MKKHALLVVATAALFTMGSLAAFAQGPPTAPGGPPAMKGAMGHLAGPPTGPPEEFMGKGPSGHSLEGLMKKLGITDEQKTQIRALYTSFRDRTRKTAYGVDVAQGRKAHDAALRKGGPAKTGSNG